MWVEPDLHAPVGRIDPAAVRLRRALHDREARRRSRRRVAARHVRFSEHVADAGRARRHARLRHDEAAVERDDALAVSAVLLVRRRRLAPRRGRHRPLRRRGDADRAKRSRASATRSSSTDTATAAAACSTASSPREAAYDPAVAQRRRTGSRDVDRRTLPQYRGELYLETHRGTYTTHRDVKSRNAALERALGEAEELCAWCVAVRAPAERDRAAARRPAHGVDARAAQPVPRRDRGQRRSARVYVDVLHEYERAERIVERVVASARSILPRGRHRAGARPRSSRRSPTATDVRLRQRLSARARAPRRHDRRAGRRRRPQSGGDRQRPDALHRQAAHVRCLEPRRGLRPAAAQAAPGRRRASKTAR